jgi:hypothetical protein
MGIDMIKEEELKTIREILFRGGFEGHIEPDEHGVLILPQNSIIQQPTLKEIIVFCEQKKITYSVGDKGFHLQWSFLKKEMIEW